MDKVIRVLAWMLRVAVREIVSNSLSAKELKYAKNILIKYSQKELAHELKSAGDGKGRFRKLSPVLSDGLWKVGDRIKTFHPRFNDAGHPPTKTSVHAAGNGGGSRIQSRWARHYRWSFQNHWVLDGLCRKAFVQFMQE